jgi:5-deoxy-glucuronate isomerase
MSTWENRSTLPNVIRNGQARRAAYTAEVTQARAGWQYSALRILELGPSATQQIATVDEEMIVLPLSGSCTVATDGETFALTGRESVFSSVTDFAYMPIQSQAEIFTESGGRFALPAARASRRLPARYGPADSVAVELRGAGQASRQVNNFCSPEAFEADRLIAVEVLTPGGNWSSYPPHKHDTATDTESQLEEIYYFEVADPQRTGAGLAYQRVYSSGPNTEIDVLAEVTTGDVVLIPHGYHGPSMAAPGYDLYYLNVMAGPGERTWRFCDDPLHAWIRGEWSSAVLDPRLPLTSATTGDVEREAS